ncbi:MAG: 2-hydroxy-3-oxopropionate reductase [Chloroflexota bacterium]
MESRKNMRVTVLGLGFMGSAIANRLLDTGYPVTVWNRTSAKAGPLVERGAVQAPAPVEAATGADVVVTLLTNDAAVREVSLGEGGVAHALPRGATLVDMSTVSPDTSRALAAAVPDGRFVDAPILGGPEATQQGKARLLLGGREDIVRALEPLWNDLSAGYSYCGDNGRAATLKILSNLILVGSITLLAEAVVVAQSLGLPNTVLRDVFGSSPAVAPGAKARLEDIMEGDHRGWWTVTLAEKDMRLALALAAEGNVDLPLTSAMERMLGQARDQGFADLDLGAIVELLRAPTRV